MEDNHTLPLTLPVEEETIIKVIGVGGGGCNAVNYMYRQGIKNVSYLVCNTDKQALSKSSVPCKLQLGPGLGAGGVPEKAQEYAEESREQIHEALDDGTKMLFIAAGMGGGTGTGASSIVAQVARELNILTVGIVTIPFAFESMPKIRKAMTGVAKLAESVDAILIINNEKLRSIYPDLNMLNAFSKSDDVVCNAAKAIADIINIPGYINTDFADVYNTLKDGKIAIMNVGTASGDERITHAISNALNSPLVNTNEVRGAKRILLQFYCSNEHAIQMQETEQITRFVNGIGEQVEVQWGVSLDDSLEDSVRVTIIATGYEVTDIPTLTDTDDNCSIENAVKQNYPPTTPSAPIGKTTEETAGSTEETAEKIVGSTEGTAEKIVGSTEGTAEKTVGSTEGTAEKTVVSTEETAEKIVVSTEKTAEKTVGSTDGTAEKTVVSTEETAEKTVVSTEETAEKVAEEQEEQDLDDIVITLDQPRTYAQRIKGWERGRR